MPECARCSDFTDNRAEGEYHYCDDCLARFREIEERGIIVEEEPNGSVHVIVTAHDESFQGGTEQSQVDGLARGKYLAKETGLPALFKFRKTDSQWILGEYLEAHPGIRQDVHERLSRVPERSSDGIIQRIREFL